MKWRPLLYRSPSRQPRQAIAPAQYSNSKSVSPLRATLYKRICDKSKQPQGLSRKGIIFSECVVTMLERLVE